mmetsp:Transcript_30627/g.47004  ORF Transcript_30627/g.47004 Transcript_30627/m.47004 type:complete len:130 (+) Transcript_30627:4658-5047(+)
MLASFQKKADYYDSSFFNQKNLQDFTIGPVIDQRIDGGDGLQQADSFKGSRVVKMPPIGKSELCINHSFDYHHMDPSSLAGMSSASIAQPTEEKGEVSQSSTDTRKDRKFIALMSPDAGKKRRAQRQGI